MTTAVLNGLRRDSPPEGLLKTKETTKGKPLESPVFTLQGFSLWVKSQGGNLEIPAWKVKNW